MNLKKVLYQKGIRQVDLVKQLGIDPARISLQINGIRPLPERLQRKLADLLQITLQELKALTGGES